MSALPIFKKTQDGLYPLVQVHESAKSLAMMNQRKLNEAIKSSKVELKAERSGVQRMSI